LPSACSIGEIADERFAFRLRGHLLRVLAQILLRQIEVALADLHAVHPRDDRVGLRLGGRDADRKQQSRGHRRERKQSQTRRPLRREAAGE
jgi:hypothetical protein